MKKEYNGFCEICKTETKRVHKNRQTKQIVCHNCYRDHFHKKLCCRCNKIKSAAKRLENEKYLCTSCLNATTTDQKIGICSVCSEQKNVSKRKTDGLIRCAACAVKEKSPEECSICHRSRRVAKRNTNSQVFCSGCYQRTLIGKCQSCKRQRVIHAKKCCSACYHRLMRRLKIKK